MPYFVRLLDTVLPERCVGCGICLTDERCGRAPVCIACAARLESVRAPRCEFCGASLISETGRCIGCRMRDHSFHSHRSLFVYDAAAASLIGAYKTKGVRTLCEFFAPLLWCAWMEGCPDSLLVPVPGNPAWCARRGWDHGTVLVREIARRWNAPFAVALHRSRGRRQKELGYEDRQRNLRGKISVTPAARSVRNRPVSLIDDVYTTGATIDECARVLIACGVTRVDALTVAMDL